MLRIYLTGEIQVEREQLLLRESALPGRQGRLAFACLVLERDRRVSRSQLAELLWPGDTPAAWEGSLSAVVSKLRAWLAGAGLDRQGTLVSAAGCYRLQLPDPVWIDVEAAAAAAHLAEGALLAGRHADAYGPALIASTISRRPLLPGEEGEWVDRQRAELRELLVRGVECLVEALRWNGEWSLALRHARELVELEPFRESGHRRLMALHLERGDRAEALRAYERCRATLASELGVAPSRETESLLASLRG